MLMKLKFYQHIKRAFCANIFAPKNHIMRKKNCAKHERKNRELSVDEIDC
jgi:hypothetical protein